MDTLDWLLDSDPAIRWQAMRDLTDGSAAAVAAERARVAREGIGAEILARTKRKAYAIVRRLGEGSRNTRWRPPPKAWRTD